MSDPDEPPTATSGRTCNVERCGRPIVVWHTRQGMRAFERQMIARADDVEGNGYVPTLRGIGEDAAHLAVPVRDLAERMLANVRWVMVPHPCRVLQAMTDRRTGRHDVAQLGDDMHLDPTPAVP